METSKDPTLNKLKKLIQDGWPKKNEVPKELIEYYSMRQDITEIDDLIYKENRLIGREKMRREFLNLTHKTHGGIGAFLRRSREAIFWPEMTNNRNHRHLRSLQKDPENIKIKEPMLSHEIGSTPWSKSGIDIFYFEGRSLLITSDYYSNLNSKKNK